MKILALIDSFKGTLTSKALGKITKEELEKKGHTVKSICISDGGDGFLDAIMENHKLNKKYLICRNPLGANIESYYLYEGTTCYIELALSSGINTLKKEELNPFITSTYGLGETIKDAINNGMKTIVIGIGGSATNDGGTGMLEALGVKFYHQKNLLENMCNEKLDLITSIDDTNLKEVIKGINFIVLSDVKNPLLGKSGATFVYSKQKGTKEEDLPIQENKMKHFGSFRPEYIMSEGSGAAGGTGYALKAYLNAKVISGIDYLLEDIDFENMCQEYDIIITGEGKVDYQSFQGKVISSVIDKAKGKKVYIVCAINETNLPNVNSIISTNNTNSFEKTIVTIEMSMNNPEYYYRELIKNINIGEEQ